MWSENTFVVDIETDGLLEDITKVHVLGYHRLGTKEVKVLTDYNQIKRFFQQPDLNIIGHNFMMYDAPALEKILGISTSYKIFDTLVLSWYLHPKRLSHSLENWGDDSQIKIKKVKIDNWVDGSIESYIERVTEDVKINTNLFYLLWRGLNSLYEDFDSSKDFWSLLTSILDVYREQYQNPFVLDVELAKNNLQELTKIKDQKEANLKACMPPVPIYKIKRPPQNMYKKDGNPSCKTIQWFKFLHEMGLPVNTSDEVKYVSGYEEPNPSSTEQVKSFLFSLGWSPAIYKDVENTKGEPNKVPQLKTKDGDLCPSVLKLVDEYPAIKELEDLSIINHRLGIVKGFLRDVLPDGTIFGDIGGITNTIRSKHRRIVNLPKMGVAYGNYIRPCLTVGDGKLLMGCDIASLENYTRTNLICDIDPSSITELLDPDFDTHLDLSVFANLMTQQEADSYKEIKRKLKNKEATDQEHHIFEKLDKIRHQAKTVNYSALYGISSGKLSKELKITQASAQKILDAYWEKNYAVRVRSESAPIKEHLDTRWIYNDIVGVWFELRSDKDKFSSLNQGMGSIIFYNWVREIRRNGVKITLNMHDEIQLSVREEDIEDYKIILQNSIDVVNNKFNLAVPIKIDISIGKNYGETH